jgi:hypothetical protein
MLGRSGVEPTARTAGWQVFSTVGKGGVLCHPGVHVELPSPLGRHLLFGVHTPSGPPKQICPCLVLHSFLPPPTSAQVPPLSRVPPGLQLIGWQHVLGTRYGVWHA